MALRCLIFSSREELVEPILPVLAELGIEGEYCRSAVDAVERVTTQLFQIVITDWEDQPEAAFLLKTARDLKAAARPLTLAVVGEDARLPEALQAGANSVLVKPIRREQVRDTMSTACELLRSKSQAQSRAPAEVIPAAALGEAPPSSSDISGTPAAGSTIAVEKVFRAREFLQSPSAAPGGAFDTECEVQKSLDHAAAAEIDALNELEPMASSVAAASEDQAARPDAAVTGWASLQQRLTRSAPQNKAEPASSKFSSNSFPVDKFSGTPTSTGSELISFSDTGSYTPAQSEGSKKDAQANYPAVESGEEEDELFDYMDGKAREETQPTAVRSSGGRILFFGLLTTALLLIAIPQTRHRVQIAWRRANRAGHAWLNPQPVAVAPAKTEHDSFAREGDEYKFPVAENIPDATTDASQIRVLPVIDPTAKPVKGAEGGNPQSVEAGAESSQAEENGKPTIAGNAVSEANSAALGNAPPNAGASFQGGSGAGVAMGQAAQTVDKIVQRPTLTPAVLPQVQASTPARPIAVANTTAIPTSLRSQIASMTPEASGAKPVEAAMSSIEPVILPESVAWSLLAEPVDPAYPDSAKASGQRGSVTLQVLIGRDGSVQDAKFLQGSLVFARAAIDAIKQWRFKPYALNGRAVSVQSAITLNFKPPS